MAFGAKIKLTVDSSKASEFRKEIQQYADTSTAKTPVYLHNIKTTAKAKGSLIRDLQQSLNSDEAAMTVRIKSIDASAAVSNLRKQLETMLSGLSITGLKEFLGTEGVENTYDKAAKSAEKLAVATENVRQKQVSANAAMQELKDIQSSLSTSYKTLSKLPVVDLTSGDSEKASSNDVSSLLSTYERLNREVQQLRSNESLRSSDAVHGLAEEATQLRQNINAILSKAAAEKRSAAEEKRVETQRETLHNRSIALQMQIQKWIVSNSVAYQRYGQSINKMLGELSDEDITSETIEGVRNNFRTIDAEMKKAGLSGQTFFETFQKGFEKFSGWSLVTKSAMTLLRIGKQVVTNVREIDTAMTELRKVTSLGINDYAAFLDRAKELSQAIGTGLTDVINATADFSRLGYDINESAHLAEAALVYKNVGDGIEDVSEATESLISTIKAFGISANDAMSIVDKFNAVGNNFAISSEGVGVALKRSAASLAAAGSTIEESIALITAMNSVIQNPEIVGTTVKTLSMYLRAAKTEAEEAGESTEGMAHSVSELREELLKLTNNQVDIMLNDSTFKSPFQIMKELSEVYTKIPDVDMANIYELIGGKRNANAIAALLANFDDAIESMKTAQNALGSAAEENETYLDSVNGKLDLLKSKFEGISSDVLSSDFVKLILDIANGLTSIVGLLAKCPPLIVAIVGAVELRNGLKKFSDMKDAVSGLVNAASAGDDVLKAFGKSIESLENGQKKAIATMLQQKLASGELAQKTHDAIIEASGLKEAHEALANSSKKAMDASNGFGKKLTEGISAMSMVSKVIGGITIAFEIIQGILWVVSQVRAKNEELIQSANDLANAYSEATNSFKSNSATLEGLSDRFKELSSGVDDNGKNIGLTANQYDEYLSIVQQIVEISPSVCKGYDNEGQAIVNYTSLLEDAIAAQKEYAETQRNIYLSGGEDFFEGKAAEYKDIQNEMRDVYYELLNNYTAVAPIDSDTKKNKAKGLQDVFRQFDLSSDAARDWARLTDDAIRLYESRRAILVALRNTGEFQEEEITDISNRINSIAAGYSKVETIQQDVSRYLAEWSKDQDWYPTIPIEALDEFADGLTDIVDVTEGYGENINRAAAFGSEFSRVLEGEDVRAILSLESGLKDGSVSIEAFNQAVSDFVESFEGDEAVLSALTALFEGLSNAAIVDTSSIGNSAKEVSDFAEAVSKLASNYKLLSTAQSEMESGSGLSDSTIQSLASETEKYLDYLYEENGVVKLNTEAWREYADTAMKDSESAIRQNIQALRDKKKILDESTVVADDYTGELAEGTLTESEYKEQVEATTQAIEAEQERLRLYSAVYQSVTASKKEAIRTQEDILSTISDYIGALKDVSDGEAMNALQTLELVKQYPELAACIIKTTNGYTLEKAAVLELIDAESKLLIVEDSLLRSRARTKLSSNGGSKATFENVDKIFDAYYEKTKKQISNMSEFRDAYSDFFHKEAPEQFLNGYEDYVKATINDRRYADLTEQLFTDLVNVPYQQEEANSSSTKEEETEFERQYKRHQHLLAMEQESVEDYLAWLNSAYKAAYASGQISLDDFYSYQEEIYSKSKELFSGYLSDEGHKISLIQNADINGENADKLIAIYERLQQEVHAQAEKYRALGLDENSDYVQELQNQWWEYQNSILSLRQDAFEQKIDREMFSIDEMERNGAGADKILSSWRSILDSIDDEIAYYTSIGYDTASDVIQSLVKEAWDAESEIQGILEQTLEDARNSLSEIQSAYETLKNAAEEYAESGGLSASTLQSICDLGVEYLSFLKDENGQLVINEENIAAVIKAKSEQLAVETALNYVEQLKTALSQQNTEELQRLLTATNSATGATWGLVYANLALLNLSNDQYAQALQNINNLRSLADGLVVDIGVNSGTDDISDDAEGAKNRAEYYDEASGSLDKILDLTMDLIRHEKKEQIEALNQQIDRYKEIIELKKKSLEAAKDEDDYNKNVAKKVKEIAAIQNKIDILSLDDSREAQSERRKLEEELAELQEDLADYQADYSLDKQEEALDAEADAFEKEKKDEIAIIEDTISSTEKLYRLAIDRIENHWDTLYSELLEEQTTPYVQKCA